MTCPILYKRTGYLSLSTIRRLFRDGVLRSLWSQHAGCRSESLCTRVIIALVCVMAVTVKLHHLTLNLFVITVFRLQYITAIASGSLQKR